MSIYKNEEDINISTQRKQALDIIEAGLKKVSPWSLLRTGVKYDRHFNSLNAMNTTYDLLRGRIFVIGGGKASGHMAEALENIINPKYITAGVVNSIAGDYKTKKIKVVKAGHPIPNKRGINGVEKMLSLKEEHNIGKGDLVICLISGGGSSLLPSPAEGISLDDMQKTTQILLESGASINEVNAVRKHLSKVKGGRLGRHFHPAQVVSLIISDVIDDDLEVIASGPTVGDNTTFSDAYFTLEKYKLFEKVPPEVADHINRGFKGEVKDTPKRLEDCDNFIIGNNAIGLEAMAAKAKSYGFRPLIVATNLQGDPNEMAKSIAKEILKGELGNYDVIIVGGETTPTLPKKYGKGGRNMHLAAVSMLAFKHYSKKWTIASVATDGADYTTGYAGAIVDQKALDRARVKQADIQEFIDKYDTLRLFKKIDNCLIKTGPTGTNVGDVVVYILK